MHGIGVITTWNFWSSFDRYVVFVLHRSLVASNGEDPSPVNSQALVCLILLVIVALRFVEWTSFGCRDGCSMFR